MVPGRLNGPGDELAHLDEPGPDRRVGARAELSVPSVLIPVLLTFLYLD
jgi:hypothetical protein